MRNIDRREFLAGSAAAGTIAAGVIPAGARDVSTSSILNYNSNMEYRRLGKTGLMVSAVCVGGHWKRIGAQVPGISGEGYNKEDFANLDKPAFLKNRSDVISRAIELGMNYVDACAPQEILAYSKVLKGRRNRMYFGFSWHTREPRYDEWRTADRLIEGFQQSLKEAQLDYVDLWRISLPMEAITDMGVLLRVEEATVGALEKAKQKGLARHTGVSSHNRTWLKSVVEQYPKQIEVVLFPYTANSKRLPDDSVFDAVKKHDAGILGIKPFADNSLFVGDSSPIHPQAAEDDRRARLALRYILGNPAITAPIPGLVSMHQVENAAMAVQERRKLDKKERAELEDAGKRMWANLRPGYNWLRDWEHV